MRNYLHSLPTTYEQLFQSSLERIQTQPSAQHSLARRAIGWIVNAKRPLKAEELLHAFAVEDDSEDVDNENFTTVGFILRVCVGLVVYDHNSSILSLVHATAYDYFLGHQWPIGETDVAGTSLSYLTLRPFSSGACTTPGDLVSRFEHLPFSSYAARHWGDHVRTSEMQRRLMAMILKLLRSASHLSSAFQASQIQDDMHEEQSHLELVIQSLPTNVTSLHLAARFDLASVTEILLEDGTDVFAKNSTRSTALHWAASSGSLNTAIKLLSKGAVVDAEDDHHWTPLIWAAFKGHSEIVRVLLNEKANHTHRNDHQKTAFHIASANEHIDLVQILLEHHERYTRQKMSNDQAYWSGADQSYGDLWVSDCFDPPMTNLWRIKNKVEAVEGIDAWLSRCCSISTNFDSKAWKSKLLHVAIKDRQLPALRMLLELGADVNSRTKSRTPLHVAAFRDDPEYARILLSKGADLSIRDDHGQLPLHEAVTNGNYEVSKIIVHHGADVNTTTLFTDASRYRICKDGVGKPIKRTSLMLACGIKTLSNDPIHIVDLLLANGADPNIMDDDGLVALHYAARSQNPQIIRRLLDFTSTQMPVDNAGRSVMHHFAKVRSSNLIEAHKAYGAKEKEHSHQNLREALRLLLQHFGRACLNEKQTVHKQTEDVRAALANPVKPFQRVCTDENANCSYILGPSL